MLGGLLMFGAIHSRTCIDDDGRQERPRPETILQFIVPVFCCSIGGMFLLASPTSGHGPSMRCGTTSGCACALSTLRARRLIWIYFSDVVVVVLHPRSRHALGGGAGDALPRRLSPRQ